MFTRLTILVLSILTLTSPVFAETPLPSRKPIEARAEANWRVGSERSILMTEFWVPFAQNSVDGSVIYGDLRMMGDDQDNREFNVGTGYREMVQTALLGEGIVGAHVWYDRRLTDRGSKFNQLTGGLEWFSDVWDAKVNAYYPLNDKKTHTQANPNGSGRGFVGNQIVVNTDQTVVEESLPGLDLELGWKVPFMDSFTDSTRIYAGGYHFEADEAENVTGWRARIASDITRDVQVGARFQSDDERGSQGFLEATVRFPFGSKQSYKEQGLYARLDESPERDIDIVSNEAVTDDGLNKNLLNGETGAVQNVIHVDNTNGAGSGTAEDPFNTLAAAEAAAGANDIIYVHRGDGTSAGQNAGITINDAGQMLIGSGSDFTFSRGRFGTSNGNDINGAAATLIAADSAGAPVLTNGAGDGVTVTADDVLLSGFTVDGAGDDSIVLVDADNAYLTNLTLTNAVDEGIFADFTGADDYTFNVHNVTATDNGGRGLHQRSQGTSTLLSHVTNSTFSNNASDGMLSSSLDNSKATVSVSNNSFISNTLRGVTFTADDNSEATIYIEGNKTSGNSINIRTLVQGTSRLRAYVTNNVGDGTSAFSNFSFRAGDSSVVEELIVSGNTIINGPSTGLNIDMTATAVSASMNNVVVRNNVISGNQGSGVVVSADVGTGSIDVIVADNIIRNNMGTGILLKTLGNGGLTASLSGNTIVGNSSYGVHVNDDSVALTNVDLGGGPLGSLGNNQIFNNVLEEVAVDMDGGTLSAENNWWGVPTGLTASELLLIDGSFIDAEPFLTVAP